MLRIFYTFISICICQTLWAQNNFAGRVLSKNSNEALINATISWQLDDGNITGVQSDLNGKFSFTSTKESVIITVSYIGFISKKIELQAGNEVDIFLNENNNLLQTATVTSGRYEIPLSEVTVSLDKFEPQLLRNANINTMDQGVAKVPGVEIIDGQANIRGGSGFSYGAGSRVLVLIDGIPFLRSDAGAVQWDDIPVENIAQVEVVKGASSALYGSSALNGVINIRTAFATNEPETRINSFYNFYDAPKDNKQKWWSDQPYMRGFGFLHKQRFGKIDFVYSRYSLSEESFNKNTNRNYNRDNINLRYRINNRLQIGAYASFNSGERSQFFYWKSLDSLYVGADNNLSSTQFNRFNIDPYLQYSAKNGIQHKLLNRYYYTDNINSQNRATESWLWYSNYQAQKKFTKQKLVLTTGLVYSKTAATAQLYSNSSFNIDNYAAYLQMLKDFGKLKLSAGIRYEHNALTGPELFNKQIDFNTGLEKYDTLKNGGTNEGRPVIRFGANYKIAKASYLRASWGQGYRFPTLAEQFVNTDLNNVPISPNPNLESETGWSSEIGFKQGFKINSFEFYVDAAVFWSQYYDMIEFNLINLYPTGFQSLNVGDTDIKGFEITSGGRKSTATWKHFWLAGYNYLSPKFKEFDASAKAFSNPETDGEWNANRSSSTENVLKYRYKHSLKLDYQIEYKNIFVGTAVQYLSQMQAIDAIFESFIVPGLQEFRAENNKGTFIVNARIGFSALKNKIRMNFLVNNLLNTAYSIRPGLMEAPRTFGIRVDIKLQ